MSEEMRVITQQQLESGPATGGMSRSTAVGADNLWVGEVKMEPGVMSGWHHHGEHTTYGRVLAGKVVCEFGVGGQESLQAGPGDFFVVPPHTVHREGNPGADEQVLVVVRIGEGPSVINVEGPAKE